MTKNYYHILGISPNATTAEIKAAYKRLALKLHPDKNPGNLRAEEQFKLVNEAYQVLSNPRRRATYDLQRQYEQQQRQPQAYAHPRYHHTRPPAGYRERHYRQRPQKTASFSKKDVKIVAGVVVLVLLILAAVLLVWNFLTYRRAKEQAQHAESNGQWEQANDYYTQVLDYQEEEQEARLRRAAVRLHHLQDVQGALADYSQILRTSQNPKADWYAARGRCYAALENHELAIQDYNTALFLQPTLLPVYQYRAESYLQAEKNWAAAIADLSHFIASDKVAPKEKTEALLYRAFAHYRTAQLVQAWQDTERALAQDSLNAKAYYLQAIIAKAQNGNPLSCELLAKAAQLGFKDAEAELKYQCAGL